MMIPGMPATAYPGQLAPAPLPVPDGVNYDPPLIMPGEAGPLQPQPDGSVVVFPLAYLGYAGQDDAGPINTALSGWMVVRLVPGMAYNILSPVFMQNGATLRSGYVSSSSASGAAGRTAAILKPAAGFTAAGLGLPVAGVVMFVGSSSPMGAPNSNQGGLNGIWIDGSTSPAGVDGIAVYGAYNGVHLTDVYITFATGNGLSLTTDVAGNHEPDGWHMNHCMINVCGLAGITGKTVDFTDINSHVQGCGGIGVDISGSNSRWVGTRSDLNAHGFRTDVFYSDGGGILLEGVGTQANTGHAVWAYNSSTNGNSPRQPVEVCGGGFYGDGTDGVSAAFQASGVVSLLGRGVQILTSTKRVLSGVPVTGIGTEKLGGNGPALVEIWGGIINATGVCVNDAAPAQLMSYRFHGVQGGVWNGAGTPAFPSLFSLNS